LRNEAAREHQPRLPILEFDFPFANTSRLRLRQQLCEHLTLLVRNVRIGKPSFEDDQILIVDEVFH
jgi:hypothetical protein